MSVFFTRRGKAAERVNYVGWLESDGNQWIDTEFKPKSEKIRIVAKFGFKNSTGVQAPFGAQTNSAWVLMLWTNGSSLYANCAASNSFSLGSIPLADDMAVFDMTADGAGTLTVTINGTTTTKSYSLPMLKTLSTYLFGCNTNGLAATFSSMRLEYWQAYDNDVLACDLRPCYDPDGVACMYDRVAQKYRYNQSTGEFVAGGDSGEDVPDRRILMITGTGSSDYCYVEINGTRYTAPATVAVENGSSVICAVANNYKVADCVVVHNGTVVTTTPESIAGYFAKYTFSVVENTTIAMEVEVGGPGNSYTWGHIEITEG